MRDILLKALIVFLILPVLIWAGAASAAPPVKLVRMTVDLGSYKGYWRIENASGLEIAHDECFTQSVCREVIKPLPEGDYVLVFSNQPQSVQVRFRLAAGGLIITSGGNLGVADDLTLRMKGLRRVVFQLSGYRGSWSLELWKGAEATGFFKRDGGEQPVELFPDITYTLNIGPFAAERFQIGRDDKIILIDDSGAVRVSNEANNRLVLQTIDVTFYPMPSPDLAQWAIEGLAPPDGRAAFTGSRILRLVQGTNYQLSEPGSGSEKPAITIATGKACNMVSTSRKLSRSTLHALPIPASCADQNKPEAAIEGPLPRRSIAP